MQENVGGIDRAIRGVAGPVLMVAGAFLVRRRPVLGSAALVTGGFLTESAVTRVCPMNAALGLDTHALRSLAFNDEAIRQGGASAGAMVDRIVTN